MCERCVKLAELIEKTRDGKSYVITTFPFGTPELIKMED